MSIEAMKQALEALGNCESMLTEHHQWLSDAQYYLRAAIESAEKQEPVAEVSEGYCGPKQPDIPEGWQAVVSEFIAAWDESADPKAVGSTCRFIRAEIALRDLIGYETGGNEMTRTEELLILAEAAIHERNNFATIELGDISHYELFEAMATPETIKQLVELCRLQNEALLLLDYGTRFDEAVEAIEAFNKFEQGGE